MNITINHNEFMRDALLQAQHAAAQDEVPIGAVIVDADANIITSDHNRVIQSQDPTAHAEISVLRKAAKIIGNYRLLNTCLYVTVEPCIMCMGALIHARVKTLVYGAHDPKWGASGSLYDFSKDRRLNHEIEVIGGVLVDECRAMMQNFFALKRKSLQ